MNGSLYIFIAKFVAMFRSRHGVTGTMLSRFQKLSFSSIFQGVIIGCFILGEVCVPAQDFPFGGGAFGFGETSFSATIDRAIGIEDIDLVLALQSGEFGVIEDLDITLTSPEGTTVHLIASGVLGDLDGFLRGDRFQDSGFSGEAPVSIEQGTPPYTALYKVDEVSELNGMTLFEGEQATGVWILKVKDTVGLGGTVYGVGNSSNAGWQTEGTRLVITVVPAPSVPDMLAESDSGASNTDDLTNVQTPVFTGTSKPNLTILLYDGDTEVATTVTDAEGSWTATIPVALEAGIHFVTARAADTNGNRSLLSPALTVLVDPIGPVIGSIADQNYVEDGAFEPVPFSVQDDVTQSTSLVITIEGSDLGLIPEENLVLSGSDADRLVTITPLPEGNGESLISITVTDLAGNISIKSFLVIVAAVNDEPIINVISNAVIPEGGELRFGVVASDIDGDVLDYALEGAPSGATIDSQSGVFVWIPTENQGPGSFDITVRASDPGGFNAARVFTVNVLEVNSPPLVVPISDLAVNEESVLAFRIAAADPDLPINEISFSLGANAPVGSVVNAATGEFTWTPNETHGPGTYPISVAVTDDAQPSLSVTVSFTVSVNEFNLVPVLQPIPSQTVIEGDTMTFFAPAVDHDIPANQLTFSLEAGAPTGALIDAATGQFGWTPSEAQGPGTYSVTLNVDDGGFGNSTVSRSFAVSVDESNLPPVLAVIPDQSVRSGTTLTLNLTASDPDLPANGLTYSLPAGAPPGAIINPATGVFTWTPELGATSRTDVIAVRVTDNGFPPQSDVKTFVVVTSPSNLPPNVDRIGDQVVDEGETLTVNVSASDVDLPIQNLTFALDGTEPDGAIIDAATGVITWSPTELQGPKVYGFSVVVTDAGTPPLTSVEPFLVVVNEANTPPAITALGEQRVQAGSPLTFSVVAVDSDFPPNSLTYSLEPGVPVGATLNADTGLFSWTPQTAAEVSTNIITLLVTDNGTPNLSGRQDVAIIVSPSNRAPVLTPIPDQEIPEMLGFTLAITSSDADQPDQTLLYALSPGAPPEASIDSVSGLFAWAPNEVQGPSINVINVTVTDDGTPPLEATGSFTLTVQEVNQSPNLDPIDDQRVEQDQLLSVQMAAGDPDLPLNDLTFSIGAGAPIGASIDSGNGLFTWTPSAQQAPSTNAITVRVTDNGIPPLSASQSFSVVATTINTLPVLAVIAPQTIDEGQVLSFTALGSDGDLPLQRLSYSLGSGAPEGASIDPNTGVFVFTPNEAQGPSTNVVSVRVTDDGSPPLRSSQDVSLVVNEVNLSPVLEPIADQALGEGDTLTLGALASDQDFPVNSLVYSLVGGAPAGASIDSASGLFTWTAGVGQGGTTNLITVLVSDDGSPALSDSKTFAAVVRVGPNLPPSISNISDQRTPENTPTSSIVFTVNDPDTPIGNLSLSAQSSNTDLVPRENIVFRGDGEDRTVEITPTRSQTGTTTIIIEVSEPAGGRTSVEFALTVNLIPAGIVREPADQTVLGGSVLTLSVAATGSAPLGYQWSFNEQAIAGATNSVLTIDSAQLEHSGGYSVEVANEVGSVMSRRAQVTVEVVLRITEQPLSQKVLTGGSASFRVGANGTPPLGYQWSVNGVEVPGAVDAVMSLVNVEPILSGGYSVEVSDVSGTVISDTVFLEVLSPVLITEQPGSQTVPVGTDVTFGVSAEGTPPLAFQWVYNGVNVVGATDSSLNLLNVNAEDAGSYSVVVSNEGGSVTSEGAQLTVSLPPVITRQPLGQNVLVGAPVNLAVAVSATPPITYQWRRNGLDVAGASGPSFLLGNVTVESAGEFSVVVDNDAGSVTSELALIEVTVPVRITTQPVDQTVVEGSGASFTVAATGTAPLSYQWRKGGINVIAATNATYAVSSARISDAGGYQVVVRNSAGPVTSATVALTVIEGVKIVTQPQSLTLTNGSTAVFSVETTGTPAVSYQWRFNGGNIPGATGLSVSLENVQPADAGAYSVVVENTAGSVDSVDAALRVLIPPSIQTHPASLAVDLGGRAEFSVASAGDAPLSYQWLRNGVNINEATGDTLVLDNVQLPDAGSYSVVVENPGGAVTSQSAILSLNLPPLTTGSSAEAAPPPIEQFEGTFFGGNTSGGGAQIARRNISPGTGNVRWFSWRAPGSGIATFGTVGSTFDTVLAVYTGTPPDLVLIGSDDDRGGFLASRVRFNAVQGTSYLFSISGFDGAVGEIVMSFSLDVTSEKLPELVSVPQSTAVLAGGEVTFAVEATGAPLSYQWLANGVEIDGATATTLVLSDVRETDALNYSVRVTSGARSVETVPASLQVGTISELASDKFGTVAATTAAGPQLLALRSQPVGLLQLGDSPATLAFSTYRSVKEPGEPNHCDVAGGASQWMKYTANQTGIVRFSTEGSDFDTVIAVYSGTEISKLTLEGCDNNSGVDGKTSVADVAVVEGLSYFIAVDGIGGVTGHLRLSYEVGRRPEITLEPRSQTQAQGDGVALFVLTSQVTGLSYQWFKDGVAVQGQTGPSLQILSVQTEDAGVYELAISNFAGTVRSQAAELIVNVPLSVNVPPVDQETGLGGLVRFAVVVSGSEPISYQWSLNEIPISGATQAVYEIANVQPLDAGSYAVRAENAAGAVDSELALLRISDVPVIVVPPESVVVALGGEAAFVVTASGIGDLTYQWRQNGLDIAGATEASLVIGVVGAREVGEYTVVVGNGVGWIETAAARLSVRVPLELVEHPRSQTVTAGSSTIFAVRAGGAGPFGYQWKKNGGEISGATASTYILTNTKEGDAGDYTVVVSSGTGSIESLAGVLTVNVLPFVTAHPQSQIVFLGSDVTLEVAAVGSGPLSYQWMHEGNAIDGATNAILGLPEITAEAIGVYSVVVSNSAGSVESQLAILTPQEVVTDVRYEVSGFSFLLNVPPGFQARVQFTTDFIEWTDLPSGAVTGAVDITDLDSLIKEFRFYRVLVE